MIAAAMPRRPKPGEIEETIQKAYDVTAIPKTGSEAPPDHLPDPQYIENIVAERIGPRPALRELEERSQPIPESTGKILAALFPADCLICVGRAFDNIVTLPLAKLRDAERHCFDCSFADDRAVCDRARR